MLFAAATVTVAVALFVASACAVALTVTVAGLGALAGAVYKPLAEIVPCVASPETCQVTAVFAAFVTVAENCCVCPDVTVAVVGDIVTLTGFCVVWEEFAAHPCSSNKNGIIARSNQFLRVVTTPKHSSSKPWACLKMNSPNDLYLKTSELRQS
jgi:hypothetical protein